MMQRWIILAALALLWAGSAAAGTNLVVNGSFERAAADDPRRPAGWDLPDGLGVRWERAPAGRGGRAIRLDTRVSERDMVARWREMEIDQWDIPKPAGNPIAATYGLSFYSDAMPVASGRAYRVSFDFLGKGGAKLWVRGYGPFRGELRRRYETIVNCRTESAEIWTHFSQVFHPTRRRPKVSEMKVMLYAYWPPGVYWFDNIQIEPIEDVATGL